MPIGEEPSFDPEGEQKEEKRTFTTPDVDAELGVEERETRRVYEDLINRRFGPAIAHEGVPDNVFKKQMASLKEQALEIAKERIKGEKDELTGLWKKNSFARLFDIEVEHMDNYGPDEVLIFLAVDLDKFKRINDTLGHEGADLVLAEFGKVSMASRRKTDFGGRAGEGDESVFALTRVKEKDVEKVLDRFMANVRSVNLSESLGNLTASVGVKVIRKGSKISYLEARKDADAAAYVAKRNGRNRCIRTDSEDMLEKEKVLDWFLLNLREDNARKLDRYSAYPELLADYEKTLKEQAALDYKLYLAENLTENKK
ncbi:MAG: GGDEF domain-containing protein [Patescibacteria group bacterium]|nr:GGDEF domain-containing protein [Patescibacteria group bacterium]